MKNIYKKRQLFDLTTLSWYLNYNKSIKYKTFDVTTGTL